MVALSSIRRADISLLCAEFLRLSCTGQGSFILNIGSGEVCLDEFSLTRRGYPLWLGCGMFDDQFGVSIFWMDGHTAGDVGVVCAHCICGLVNSNCSKAVILKPVDICQWPIKMDVFMIVVSLFGVGFVADGSLVPASFFLLCHVAFWFRCFVGFPYS